jgi:hypothetical protein
MWNDTFVQRDAESINGSRDKIGFIDAKGVVWSVIARDMPERQGRIALDFASVNGKRRSAQIKSVQLDELRALDEIAWRKLLANAAVIELE